MDQTFVMLKESTLKQLDTFVEMEKDDVANQFVILYSIKKHRNSFSQPGITYLTVYHKNKICGYFLLSLDSDENRVELRRVIVSEKGKGIGQKAIIQMHQYCKTVLKRSRIWLDVFAHNPRGLHIYEKLGYTRFKSEPYGDHILHFYEKSL